MEATPATAPSPRPAATPAGWVQARAMFWLAFVASACLTAAWLVGGEVAERLLRTLIRPQAAAGALCCSIALGGRLYGDRHKVQVLSLLGSAAAGVAGIQCVYKHLLHTQLHALPPPWHAEAQNLPPLGAGLLLWLALCSFGLALRPAGRSHVILATMAVLSSLVCAGFFLCAVLAQVLPGIPYNASTLLLPGAALLFLLISLGLVLSAPTHPLVVALFSAQPGARLTRRLGIRLVLCTAAFFVSRSLLSCSSWAWVQQEERSLLATVVVALIAALLYDQTKLANLSFAAQQRALTSLETSLQERRALVARLASEKAQLASVFRAAVNHSIVATDLAGTVTLFTEGATQMLGYAPHEVLGKLNVTLFHDPEELQQRGQILGLNSSFDVLRALSNLGLCEQRTWHYVSKTGQRVPVQLSTTAIEHGAGQVVGYLFVARDISQEEHARRDIAGFLSIGQELLIKTDPENCIVSTSPSFERVLGYKPQDLLGRPVVAFIHPQDLITTRAAVRDMQNGQHIQRFENRWLGKDNRYRTISWDATMPNKDGYNYGGGWDVTDEKLRAKEREQHLAFEQKIIGIVSHDLRCPLSAISMAEQMIRRQPNDAAAREKNLTRIAESCAHATRLIHDMLDFSRSRLGGGLGLQLARTDMVRLARRAVQEVGAVYPQRAILLDAPPRATATVDGERLLQLLGNLLVNGLKYGAQDAPVRLRLEQQAEQTLFTVSNAGNPIAKELVPRLFEPFRRGEAPRKPQEERDASVGLGLYIVSEVVRAHQGSIEVESDHVAGTHFRISLPNAPPGDPRPGANL